MSLRIKCAALHEQLAPLAEGIFDPNLIQLQAKGEAWVERADIRWKHKEPDFPFDLDASARKHLDELQEQAKQFKIDFHGIVLKSLARLAGLEGEQSLAQQVEDQKMLQQQLRPILLSVQDWVQARHQHLQRFEEDYRRETSSQWTSGVQLGVKQIATAVQATKQLDDRLKPIVQYFMTPVLQALRGSGISKVPPDQPKQDGSV